MTCDNFPLHFAKGCGILCLVPHLQGWYIGITAASQAVKAGSIPVPCSNKISLPLGRLILLELTIRSGTRRWHRLSDSLDDKYGTLFSHCMLMQKP